MGWHGPRIAATSDPNLTSCRTEPLGRGVYAYVQPDGGGWINNAGFIVGDDVVVSVDTCFTELRTRAYRAAIRRVTRTPVRIIVNTHEHSAHTDGNGLFAGATIVGHRRCREQVIAGCGRELEPDIPVERGVLKAAPPFLTFKDELTLHVGDLRCEVRYVGRVAHTSNDVVVWIPETGVLFTGDLVVHGGTPFVPSGSISGSITVLDELQGLNPSVIVPGHGDVCGPEVIDDTIRYFRWLQDVAAGTKALGSTPLEVARSLDLGSYRDWREPERIVVNLTRAFLELDGAEPGAPIDLQQAFADTLAYRGEATCVG